MTGSGAPRPAPAIQRGALRSSTIRASIAASEQRLKQTAKSKGPRKTKGVLRRLTQEELLDEAKRTEIINRASLEAMLKIQESKKAVAEHKAPPSGPRVVMRSRGGITTLTFTEADAVPACLQAKAPTPPEPPRCVVTGLPARYRDPQTGAPYATLDAFRTIRGRGRSRSQNTAALASQ